MEFIECVFSWILRHFSGRAFYQKTLWRMTLIRYSQNKGLLYILRSSHNAIHKNFVIFTGKQLCWSLFFNKVTGLHVFFKKRLQYRCFPVNIVKSLRNIILRNICQRLFLYPAHLFGPSKWVHMKLIWSVNLFVCHFSRLSLVFLWKSSNEFSHLFAWSLCSI